MSDLTRDEELALVTALKNGRVRLEPGSAARDKLLGIPLVYVKRGREDDLFELNEHGRRLATTLRDCNDANERVAELEAEIELLQKPVLFSKSTLMDVQKSSLFVPPGQDWNRFSGYAVRITVDALYPIGEPVEAGEMEGRDA